MFPWLGTPPPHGGGVGGLGGPTDLDKKPDGVRLLWSVEVANHTLENQIKIQIEKRDETWFQVGLSYDLMRRLFKRSEWWEERRPRQLDLKLLLERK